MPRAAPLTEGPIHGRLVRFAIPILLTNVLQTLNASVNAIWVGRFLGEAALTATSNSSALIFLAVGSVFGLSMAATILVGQYLGAQRLADAKRVVGTSASFFLAVSAAIAAGGWLACEPLMRAMGMPADALPLAVAYMRVIFLAVPFMYLYAFVMSVLRGAGDSRTPLAFMALSVGLDIALNPVLIFGAGPLPALGIAGSALATLLAQGVSLGALLVHLYRRRHPLCLHGGELGLLRLDWSIIATLVLKGVPMALQFTVVSLGVLLMITLVNRFGVDTAAAYGACYQLWNYVQMPAFALGMAVTAMAAQNIGAGKWERVAATARAGVLYSALITGAAIAVVEIFSAPALGLFLPAGSPAVAVAEHVNRIVAWGFVFFGVSLVLFGVVRAAGAVVPPLLILALTLLGLRYPLAAGTIDRFGADAIWWSFPLSSLVSMVLGWLYYRYGGWRRARMMRPSGTESAPAGRS